jgi:hypothetical protein
MSTADSEHRKPKHRSPSYPSLDLETAIERTQQLWTHAQRYAVPIGDAMDLWGYSRKSSGGLLTIAALKKYGLAEDEGSGNSRMIRVSDEGRALVLDQQDSPQRQEKLQRAALTPSINRELWEKYDASIPPDSTLRFYLINDRAFSENAAKEVSEVFRRSLEFARLTSESVTVSPSGADTQEKPGGPTTLVPPLPPVPPFGSLVMPTTAPPPIQFPVYGGGTVMIQSTAPLTEVAWDQMMEVLRTLKPAIIGASQVESPGSAMVY